MGEIEVSPRGVVVYAEFENDEEFVSDNASLLSYDSLRRYEYSISKINKTTVEPPDWVGELREK